MLITHLPCHTQQLGWGRCRVPASASCLLPSPHSCILAKPHRLQLCKQIRDILEGPFFYPRSLRCVLRPWATVSDMGKDSYTTQKDSRSRRDDADREKEHKSKRRKRESHGSRADSDRPRQPERREAGRQPDHRQKDPDKVCPLIMLLCKAGSVRLALALACCCTLAHALGCILVCQWPGSEGYLLGDW